MTWGQLAALAGLGAFHGLNPAMGWLFAVARGMQERSRWALLRSLPPIAAGHLASVAIVAAVVSATRSVVAANVVGIAGGVVLVGFGLWRLLSERHFRWAGMRLSLAAAGRLVVPGVVGARRRADAAAGAGHRAGAGRHTGHMVHRRRHAAAPRSLPWTGLAAAGVHTIAMFTVMAMCALLVYEFVGVSILRKAWFNMDRLWAGVMVGAGALTIALTA